MKQQQQQQQQFTKSWPNWEGGWGGELWLASTAPEILTCILKVTCDTGWVRGLIEWWD